MIRRIFLDLDDVCNTLAPFVLHSVGGDLARSTIRTIRGASLQYLGRRQRHVGRTAIHPGHALGVDPAFNLMRGSPNRTSFLGCWTPAAQAVGRENVCIATRPQKNPDCLAGKLEWIHDHFPEWMHRQYAITPRKHLFARPDSLLIDDYSENIERFEAHGGHAITVPRPWNEHWALNPRRYLKEN